MPKSISIDGEFAFVELTKGYVAKIDVFNLDKVKDKSWRALVKYKSDGTVRTVYAITGINSKLMHRELMHDCHNLEIDHIDGNGLNCCVANMRYATKSNNMQNSKKPCNNSSGVKGVCWHKRGKKWEAYISTNGKRKHLGLFSIISDAETAYKNASSKYHGEFGRIE